MTETLTNQTYDKDGNLIRTIIVERIINDETGEVSLNTISDTDE